MRKNKNVYGGKQGKFPVIGSVDSDREVLINVLVTAFNALDNKVLPGHFAKNSVNAANNRFAVLYANCKKHNPLLCPAIQQIQGVVNESLNNGVPYHMAVAQLQGICLRFGLNPVNIEQVMVNSKAAQNGNPIVLNPFQQLMFVNKKKRGLKK